LTHAQRSTCDHNARCCRFDGVRPNSKPAQFRLPIDRLHLGKGASLLTFGDGAQYKAGPGFAAPDASVFPDGDFYIRALTLTYFAPPHFFWHWLWSAEPSAWALVGRYNSLDDDGWVSPVVPAGQSVTINFPADAAPIFHHNGAAFFDAHVDSCRKGYTLMFAVWYPATAKSLSP
jgi:hypothetical protein